MVYKEQIKHRLDLLEYNSKMIAEKFHIKHLESYFALQKILIEQINNLLEKTELKKQVI